MPVNKLLGRGGLGIDWHPIRGRGRNTSKSPHATEVMDYLSRTQSLSFLIHSMFLGENDDVMVVDEPAPSRKRKADNSELETEEQQDLKNAKRARVSNAPVDEDESDVIVL